MMKKTALKIKNIVKEKFAVGIILAIIFFASAQFSEAQSTRASKAPRLERVPEWVQKERAEAELRDVDVFIGRVVRKDGNKIIVHITGNTVRGMENRIPLFYAVDTRMRPIAILEDKGVSHKSCATFTIAEGDAKKGDTVRVKYIVKK